MIQIFAKEFNGFLHSLIAYLVIGVFLTGMGLLTWVFPDTSVLDYGFADLDTLFSMAPYVFIFLIPGNFTKEKKSALCLKCSFFAFSSGRKKMALKMG